MSKEVPGTIGSFLKRDEGKTALTFPLPYLEPVETGNFVYHDNDTGERGFSLLAKRAQYHAPKLDPLSAVDTFGAEQP